MTIPCTIIDRYEGKLHVEIQAPNDDAAHEEAHIAAAENGCRDVVEIIIGIHE